jgi:hypothetical protein
LKCRFFIGIIKLKFQEFTWTIREPKFNLIHHFQFGHFRRSVHNDNGIYLKMEFSKTLPMFKSDISTLESPKEFIKYLIRVERKKSKSKLWQKIFERKLDESEIQAGQPFKLELVKKPSRGKDHYSDMDPRLMNPQSMNIIVEKVKIVEGWNISNEKYFLFAYQKNIRTSKFYK